MRPEEKTHEVANICKLQIHVLYTIIHYSYTMMYKVFWQYRQDATIPTIKDTLTHFKQECNNYRESLLNCCLAVHN